MPQRYDFAVPNESTTWNLANVPPHGVVINLGTNDFGPGKPGEPYVDAYVAFARHVRSKYANTQLILIDVYGGDSLTLLNRVITALKSDGESKVEMLGFNSVPNNNSTPSRTTIGTVRSKLEQTSLGTEGSGALPPLVVERADLFPPRPLSPLDFLK